MNLDSYAAARGVTRPGPACTVCSIFMNRPDVAHEIRANRKGLAPYSYKVIAGYLSEVAQTPVTMNKVRDHFYSHEGDGR